MTSVVDLLPVLGLRLRSGDLELRGLTDEDLVIPVHDWSSVPWNAIQDSVYAVQLHWLHCLATGQTPETSGPDTLKLLDITLGAYQSAATGQQYRVGSLS